MQPAKHARKPQRDGGRRACTWLGRAAGSPVSGMGTSFGAEHHPTPLARHATLGVVSTQDTCSEHYQDRGGRTGVESGVGVSQSHSRKIRKETSHLRAEVGQPRSGCSTGRLKGTDGQVQGGKERDRNENLVLGVRGKRPTAREDNKWELKTRPSFNTGTCPHTHHGSLRTGEPSWW